MSEVPESVPSVGLADIEAARELLRGVAIETPMEESRWLSALAGGPVSLKCENLQRTGSFKARGAYTRISRLSAEERAHGVVAASAGNHAQGVALAAQMLGIKATIFMPEGAPIPKEKATRGYGADVSFHGRYLEDALVEARAFADRTGAVLIHPFDHVDIVAGQGTAGLEILEQAPDVQTVLVPTGGGGLLAGIAIAVKALRPDVRVVGVQAAGAAAYPGSLGARCPRRAGVDDHDGRRHRGRPARRHHVRGRPRPRRRHRHGLRGLPRARRAGRPRARQAAGRAGRRRRGRRASSTTPTAFGTPAVAVLSGGNIDPLLLGKVIRHGMAAAGRYLNLRVCIPDLPGGLAQLLGDISAVGANVLEVVHERISPTLHLHEVEVHLQLETRGEPHTEQLLARLRERGYRVFE